MNDIAIVGLACRLPGAANVDEYWQMTLRAARQFCSIPPDRWRHETFYDPHRRGRPLKTYTDQASFLDDVDRFASPHYGIPPLQAENMDPQHRLLIDLAREALQDAGWERRPFDRTRTGVFVGMNQSDHQDLMATRLRATALANGSLHAGQADSDLLAAIEDAADTALTPVAALSLPGTMLNMAPCAVSSAFDLGGPSLAVDSACSSALVALHEAVSHLRSGTCAAAVVGGVFLSLTPDVLIGLSMVGAVSADGVCRPFDERADGLVLGEGGALAVLRPLDDALRAGDRVYGVIKGIGASNDGARGGLMTPVVEGQLAALRAAYSDAGVSPSTVELIEAHGTGTPVGDCVEVDALRAVRREGPGSQTGHCYLSSVKALIGHLMSAAGAASLARAALALHHAIVPPQPETVADPRLSLADAGFQITERAIAWNSPRRHPRRAAVSAFGFGGTNVHVVLEEAPGHRRSQKPAARSVEPREKPQPFLLSAGSVELLAEHAGVIREKIAADAGLSPSSVAYTLATRTLLPARLAFVAATREEVIDRLDVAAAALRSGATGDLGDGIHAAVARASEAIPEVVFLYPGQGVQRVGMLEDLYRRFPSFRKTAERLGASVHRDGSGISLTELIWRRQLPREDAERALTETQICQPALGVLGIAMSELLADCGVRPDIVLGHSVGEFPAAVAAGALNAEDAAEFLVHRGAAVAASGTPGSGGMLAVQATEERFVELAAGIDGVWPGCFNQPGQVVASGSAQALERLAERCGQADIVATPLRVSHAFHSPLVAEADAQVAERLTRLPLRQPGCVFVSTVSGRICADRDELRSCWLQHCSMPVRFGAAAHVAAEGGGRVFVQLYGGNGLLAMARRSVPDPASHHFVSLSLAEPDDGRTFLAGLGRLAVLGPPVDLLSLFDESERTLLTLPASPLATQPYTIRKTDPRRPAAYRYSKAHSAPTHHSPERRMNDVIQLLREQLAVLRGPADTEAFPAVAGNGAVTAELRSYSEPATQGRPAADAELTPAPAQADIRDRVFAAVAKICGYPYEQLRGSHAIGGDLGFDSVMITDLFVALGREWQDLSVDITELSPVTTIDDVVRIVAGEAGAGEEAAGHGPGSGAVPESVPEHLAVPASAGTPVSHAARGDLSECVDISRFPEIVNYRERRDLMVSTGLRNPYFVTHEGNVRDCTRVAGNELISYSSYNYLGLSGHPTVTAAVKDAVDRYGSSVSAARLLSGDRPLHCELDAALADLVGTEDALGLVSGHATNVTVIGHLFGPGDLIVHDALAHDSILQGCALSGATRRPFPHNDIGALDTLLSQIRHQFRRVLIVVEGVYSMDGDIPDLPALIQLKKRHGALLMIDEAHSIGVLGAGGGGIGQHFGVDRTEVDIWMGTLSKSFASCGGFVAGRHDLIEYLKYNVPGFIYSAGMTPPNAAAALAAIRQMDAEPERLARLHERSNLFLGLAKQVGVDTGRSEGTPVIPCVVGDSFRCVQLSNALFERGICVAPILYPAVEERLVRLRFFVTSEHTPEQIAYTVDVLADQLDRLEGIHGTRTA